ncbi:hypothetical protein DFP72DRAFT_873115 [Ephemerocybe angulata]|uniref:Duf1665 domain containing protein n=1 Tax=Ephemerocybe angulata TaxID=980116 RepID=A0A8H6MF87_9AGAR|nr:hypothetical protein DFP72DRAFT_873115 [Tulosesus angulatus]
MASHTDSDAESSCEADRPTELPKFVQPKPGHGVDIETLPDGDIFPNAILHCGGAPRLKVITIRERTMLGFINAVTDKPEWNKKVFDQIIIEKWKEETVNLDSDTREQQMSELMFSYCIQELQYRASELDTDSPGGSAVHVFPGDVYKSDSAVPEETRLALLEAVRPLEEVPDSQKDWHPGSNGTVLDLVHPSLFPLVYGVSKVLPLGANITTLEDCIKRCGEGEAFMPEFEGESVYPTVSAKLQWLPCEVDISGDRPRIMTYINNLHPTHHIALYHIIEDLIGASIPLWNLTLAPHVSPDEYSIPRRISYESCTYNPDPERDETNRPLEEDSPDEAAWDAALEAWHHWCVATRRVELPEPPHEFEPLPEPEPFNLKDAYGRLQVIVKIANIELTPEKPQYSGGSWHVEGMMNEAICATAIYYSSCSNITPSSLAFRQQSADLEYDDVGYEQYHHDWLPVVFGLQNEEPTIQALGSVQTMQGRLITFPNILQHQVQPFKLDDPTKPGHRKIVALFLVDPYFDIISTADVPAQRLDWWREELSDALSLGDSTEPKNAFGKLPLELRDTVFEEVDGFPISWDKAKEYREQLMEERKAFLLGHQEDFAGMSISLCEH